MATIAATHTVVKSSPADHPFGVGILRSLPFERREHTYQDELDWAAETLSGDGWDAIPNDVLEDMARESMFMDLLEVGIAAGERCRGCGLPDEGIVEGRCPSCTEIEFMEHLARVAAVA